MTNGKPFVPVMEHPDIPLGMIVVVPAALLKDVPLGEGPVEFAERCNREAEEGRVVVLRNTGIQG